MERNLTSAVVIITTAFLTVAMIVPATIQTRRKAKHAKCKSNLKNIGTGVAAYFADGTYSTYPQLEECLAKKGWLETLEIASEIITCPVKNRAEFIYEKGA